MTQKYRDKKCIYALYLFIFILPIQNFPCLTILFSLFPPKCFFSLPQNLPKFFSHLRLSFSTQKFHFSHKKGLEAAGRLPTEGLDCDGGVLSNLCLHMFHMLMLLL